MQQCGRNSFRVMLCNAALCSTPSRYCIITVFRLVLYIGPPEEKCQILFLLFPLHAVVPLVGHFELFVENWRQVELRMIQIMQYI